MRHLLLALVVALSAAAAGVHAARADDPTPGVQDVNGAKILDSRVVLAQPLEARTFTWMHDQAGDVSSMPSASTHVCLLTKVSGKFAGMGERIELTVDAKTGKWRILGSSGQDELMGQATCAKKIKFVPAAAHPEQLAAAFYTGVSWAGCEVKRIPTPDDVLTHAFFLNVVGGRFSDGTHAVEVVNASGKGGLNVTSCDDFTTGGVMSLADTRMPGAIFRDVQGKLGVLSAAGKSMRVEAATGAGVKSQLLSPVDEALCGLTQVQGKMQGYGEFIQIVPVSVLGKKYWALQARESGDGGTLSASARCFSRNQFKPPV